MILADSNLIIYAASGKYPDLVEWFIANKPVVSAVTLLEVLGYHKLKTNEKATLESLFAETSVIYPFAEVFQKAIELRQQRKVSIGDALIASTALVHHFALATHNTSDFDWIDGLDLTDPLSK
ncbi:MAG: type II toxin-antitoxin system VapC family toxin [Anaerolineales bacterium]|nr:type II toxin-antitoxin system VapC family toxin [Anaerolineales bacterium]